MTLRTEIGEETKRTWFLTSSQDDDRPPILITQINGGRTVEVEFRFGRRGDYSGEQWPTIELTPMELLEWVGLLKELAEKAAHRK